MSIYTIMRMNDIGLLLHVPDTDSFAVDLVEDSYVMDSFSFDMMDMSLCIVDDQICYLDIVVEIPNDMEVTTNVDFDDVADLHATGRMNIYIVMHMDDIGLLLHVFDMDSFVVDFVEDSYVINLYAFTMMDMRLYIVANLIFMYEDAVMDDADVKL